MLIRHHRWWALIFMTTTLLGCNGNGPRPGEFDPTEITLREATEENVKELMDEKLSFVDPRGEEWIAPRGTWTDGASVPRLALWITDGRFEPEFLKAAVVHDAYCQEFNVDKCPEQYQKRPWRDVHRMFYDGCVAGGTSEVLARIMFAAVWLGGPRWDDPDSDLQIVPDEVLRTGFAGCENWIEENNPTREEIESWMGQREPTVLEVSKLEARAVSALRAGDVARAGAAQRRSEQRLEAGLDELPNDLMLLSLSGYHHKNRATVYRELQMNNKVDEELDKAERAYQRVISIEQRDPSTLIGLGGVMILRNDLDRAEGYVRRALDVEPDHPVARRDLRRIEELRNSGP